MNRLESLSTLSPPRTQSRRTRLEAGVFSPAGALSPWALFAPLHYEANYAYPLLVWLHGGGGDERQLSRIMPHVSLRNYVAVAPRGPVAAARVRGAEAGFDWPQSPRDIVQAEVRVFDALANVAQRLHIAPTRIFLAGFDNGGTMALRLAMDHPTRFAGVLSLCGRFPTGCAPLARLNHARRVPLFVACGRDSADYPPEAVCDDLRLFHAAGMEVALRQYPCGQEISTQMLADMDRWIMERINGIGVMQNAECRMQNDE